MKEIFEYIYKNNYWNSAESRSGCGSELRNTKEIRDWLSILFKKYGIKSMADAPCGDFNWMQKVHFPDNFFYLGCDIVDVMIENNNKNYSTDHIQFLQWDVTFDLIPQVDLIFCKDLFLHLSLKDCMTVIEMFKHSGSKYLIISDAIHCKENKDKVTGGDHRMINMRLSPFNFPRPIEMVNPGFTQMSMYKFCDL